jgi:hypothetical protein
MLGNCEANAEIKPKANPKTKDPSTSASPALNCARVPPPLRMTDLNISESSNHEITKSQNDEITKFATAPGEARNGSHRQCRNACRHDA